MMSCLLDYSHQSHWGAVAEWVRALACTGDRTVLAGFESHCGKLRNSVYPRFASVFRMRHQKPSVLSIWCLCQGK